MKHWTRHLPIDRRLAAWLAAGGSLTAHIRGVGHDFRVRRLMQRCTTALPEEAGVVRQSRGITVREVLLMEGDVPLVFAHSIVSQSRTDGAWRAVRGLGSRPLAELLFADHAIVRGPLRFRAVTAADPLGRRVSRALPGMKFPLWARRSTFYRRGAPLMVTEVFLPPIGELAP